MTRWIVAAVWAAVACAEEGVPPSIHYGRSRDSKAWVETAEGNRVAVDEGVAWQGVKAFLSLDGELVVQEEAGGKLLWSRHVGAFWTRLGFREVETKGGKRWVVWLRPEPGDGPGSASEARYELRTGADFTEPASRAEGVRIEPRASRMGGDAAMVLPCRVLVTTEGNWKALRARLFGAKDPGLAPDFSKEMVLAVCEGDVVNCRGIACAEALREGDRLRLRLSPQWFQTEGGCVTTRAYGVFVLPRAKRVDLERDEQSMLDGPAVWSPWGTLEGDAPDLELKALPPFPPLPEEVAAAEGADLDELRKVLRDYRQVPEKVWTHFYSHAGAGDRKGTATLSDGTEVAFLLRLGGLATVTLADGRTVFLAREAPRYSGRVPER